MTMNKWNVEGTKHRSSKREDLTMENIREELLRWMNHFHRSYFRGLFTVIRLKVSRMITVMIDDIITFVYINLED